MRRFTMVRTTRTVTALRSWGVITALTDAATRARRRGGGRAPGWAGLGWGGGSRDHLRRVPDRAADRARA
jgi:hypothetical protein